MPITARCGAGNINPRALYLVRVACRPVHESERRTQAPPIHVLHHKRAGDLSRCGRLSTIVAQFYLYPTYPLMPLKLYNDMLLDEIKPDRAWFPASVSLEFSEEHSASEDCAHVHFEVHF